MKDCVQTVTGKVKNDSLGICLVHEHFFNDLSGCVDEPFYPYSKFIADKKVSPDIAYGLRYDPYCNKDNMSEKDVADVCDEVEKFIEIGGRTIVEATGSASIGRNIKKIHEVAVAKNINVIASTGYYLSKFETEEKLLRKPEIIAKEYDNDLNIGIDGTDIKAGLIGELGVSPRFTPGEKNNLRAGAIAQQLNPSVSVNIHMPGWMRFGDEVLDIMIDEMGANPEKISLAHSDPSGEDFDYQKRLLDRGIYIEFDMIAQDISFPKEGVGPSVPETVNNVYNLIKQGYEDQIVLSHDVFLKQMWTKNGGNGFIFVPTVFVSLLMQKGVSQATVDKLLRLNPAKLLA
ncbi:phosphotriesterase family protein [Anaerobiospirillum thomasii]|uniref:Phosphotriesterase homology protein n=1 Tax=Anaerobiospirillum thomasii TaxID=179995 RepID=A0A2X0WTZ8_9GAMM|nr:phosphotriesterase [Anaerobiospirillum thomasii]SPT68941.1 Phosphotriesterase homology protein [Anaerobiospirillum thomasii]